MVVCPSVICIQKQDGFTTGGCPTCVAGSRSPLIFLPDEDEGDGMLWIGCFPASHGVARPIGGAIINHNQLESSVGKPARPIGSSKRVRYVARLLVERDDHGNHWN